MQLPLQITFRNLPQSDVVEAEVRFSEAEGEKGPQASTTGIIGKRGKYEHGY